MFHFGLPQTPWAKCSSQIGVCDAWSEWWQFAFVRLHICTSDRNESMRRPHHRNIFAHILWCNCRVLYRWTQHPPPFHSVNPPWRPHIYLKNEMPTIKLELRRNWMALYLYFTRTILILFANNLMPNTTHSYAFEYWQLSIAVTTIPNTFSKLAELSPKIECSFVRLN